MGTGMRSSVHETVRSLRDELYDLASDLVKRKSVTGDEDHAQRALADRLRSFGLEVDLWRIDPGMSSDPYSGEIRGGTLYGRGSCDMKGGIAAAAIAIRAAMKLGIEPRRPILLESVVGEETGGLGTLTAIARGYRADAAVITEPTSLELCPVDRKSS